MSKKLNLVRWVMASGRRLFTGTHVFIYRLSRGRIGGRMWNSPVMLLTTVGRKSGKKRTTPLLYLKDGERTAIVASNGGRAKEPLWWSNLKRDPHAMMQIRKQKQKVLAKKATEEETSVLWPLLTKMYPAYNDYKKRTTREIPVVVLVPDPSS